MTPPTSSVCLCKHLLQLPEDCHATPKCMEMTDVIIRASKAGLWSAPRRRLAPCSRTRQVPACAGLARWVQHGSGGGFANVSTRQKHEHVFRARVPEPKLSFRVGFYFPNPSGFASKKGWSRFIAFLPETTHEGKPWCPLEPPSPSSTSPAPLSLNAQGVQPGGALTPLLEPPRPRG